jgi:hypothetical protein
MVSDQVFDRSTSYNDRKLVGDHDLWVLCHCAKETDIEELRHFQEDRKEVGAGELSSCFSRNGLLSVADKETFQPDLFFVILGGVLIFWHSPLSASA